MRGNSNVLRLLSKQTVHDLTWLVEACVLDAFGGGSVDANGAIVEIMTIGNVRKSSPESLPVESFLVSDNLITITIDPHLFQSCLRLWVSLPTL